MTSVGTKKAYQARWFRKKEKRTNQKKPQTIQFTGLRTTEKLILSTLKEEGA